MSSSPPVEAREFLQRLQSTLADQAVEADPTQSPGSLAESFLAWATALLEEEGVIDGFDQAQYEYCPPGRPPVMRLDGYYLEEDPTRPTLFVAAVVDYSEGDGLEPVTLTAVDVDLRLKSCLRFISWVLIPKPDEPDPLHTLEPTQPPYQIASRLREARDQIRRIRVVMLTNTVVKASELDQQQVGEWPVEVDVWDLVRLGRLHSGGSEVREEIRVDFEQDFGAPLVCVAAPNVDARYRAYLGVLSGKTLSSIYARFGPRLLEANVRSFLQAKGKINSGIRKTIQADPGGFFAYNNGISAIATDVEFEEVEGTVRIRSLRGLQIVNGAQTTGSLHRAVMRDKAELDHLHVPLKLTWVKTEDQRELIQNISRYSNNQNPVKLPDFSANSPFLVRIEELSRRIWVPPEQKTQWFFERARGQYEDEKERAWKGSAASSFKARYPASKKFTKTDLAIYCHAWEGKPHLVSMGAQKNFGRFVADWLDDEQRRGWIPDERWFRELVAKAIVYRSVAKAATEAEVKSYKANVVHYIVSIIADRTQGRFDFERVWNAQEVSPELRQLAREWCPIVRQALVDTSQGRNVTEWCKKADCWTEIRKLELPGSLNGLPEVAHGAHDPIPHRVDERIDLEGDRAKLLATARDVVRNKTLTREAAISALKSALGISRLTAENRQILEGLLDDLPRVAFLDDEETVAENEGLAKIRAFVRPGPIERTSLLRSIAREHFGRERLGMHIRNKAEALLSLASHRQIVHVRDGTVQLRNATIDDYSDDFLISLILSLTNRKGRVFMREEVVRSVSAALGFGTRRASVDARIETLLTQLVERGIFSEPSPQALLRERHS